jgi:hypothetical protein
MKTHTGIVMRKTQRSQALDANPEQLTSVPRRTSDARLCLHHCQRSYARSMVSDQLPFARMTKYWWSVVAIKVKKAKSYRSIANAGPFILTS